MATEVSLKYASPSEWETHKTTINRLYIEENRPLKEVMTIMHQEYKFRATPKMYKDRFQKWGLAKHLNAAEVLAILRAKTQREKAGKSATEFIRQGGALIDYAAVERYLLRNPSTASRFQDRDEGRSLDALRILCRTPPLGTPDRALRMPDALSASEDILRAMREFIGVYLAEPGLREADLEVSSQQDDLVEAFRLVSTSIRLGFDARILRVLNRAFEGLGPVLRKSGPILLIRIIHEVRLMTEWVGSRIRVDEAVAKYVARLSSLVLGRRHPQSRIWSIICQNLDLITSWEFTSRVGTLGSESYWQNIEKDPSDARLMIDMLRMPGNVNGGVQEQEEIFRAPWRRVMALGGEMTPLRLKVLLIIETWMAGVYTRHGEYEKADRAIRDSRVLLQNSTSDALVSHYEAKIGCRAAELEEARGNLPAAAGYLRQAVEVRRLGGNRRRTQETLYKLEAVLCKMGENDEVAQVRGERIVCLNQLIDQCEPLEKMEAE